MTDKLIELALTQGAGVAIALVLLVFYRRDHLHKQAWLREAHDRRDAREDRLLAIVERQAAASEALVQTIAKLDATLTEHHRFAAAYTERLGVQVDAIPGKVALDVAGAVERALWQQHGRGEP